VQHGSWTRRIHTRQTHYYCFSGGLKGNGNKKGSCDRKKVTYGQRLENLFISTRQSKEKEG
jgi:hypothetical protein